MTETNTNTTNEMIETITILTVDNRETKVIPDIRTEFELGPVFDNFVNPNNEKIKTTYNVATINAGDYIISSRFMLNGEEKTLIHACIERKSFKDLAASIKDNRVDNIEKMARYRTESNCCLYLLIEGPHCPTYQTQFANIKYQQLLAVIDSLMIKDNVKVIHTPNKKESARRMKFLTESYAKVFERDILPKLLNDVEHNNIQHNRLFGGLTESLGNANFTTDQQDLLTIIKAWSTLGGITKNTARIIQEHYSITDFITGKITNETVNNIIDTQTGRKLSPGVINVLTKKYNLNNTQSVKLLSCFPQLSQSSAGNLLLYKKLSELCNMTEAELAQQKINDKQKLGNKKAQTVYKFLHNKKFNITVNTNQKSQQDQPIQLAQTPIDYNDLF